MIFFDGWAEVLRVAITALVMYVSVVFFIRLSGKRTTSQMNNFDWIVTVAMGSMVGSAIVSKSVTVLSAITGIGFLLILQYAVTRALLDVPLARKIIRARPRLLFYRGRFLEKNMRSERVLRDEVLAAIRDAGIKTVDEVEAVVLETDATFSVLSKGSDTQFASLEGVWGEPGVQSQLQESERAE